MPGKDRIILDVTAGTPKRPPAGKVALYLDSSGALRGIDSNGAAVVIGAAAAEDIGTFKIWGNHVTYPTRGTWLACDGGEQSRTTYAALFALWNNGAFFGFGNGSTTFNMPDFRGRVPVCLDNLSTAAGAANRLPGFGNPSTPGTAFGAETHSLNVQSQEIQSGSGQNAVVSLDGSNYSIQPSMAIVVLVKALD